MTVGSYRGYRPKSLQKQYCVYFKIEKKNYRKKSEVLKCPSRHRREALSYALKIA